MAYRHDDRGDIVMSRYYKAEDVIRAIEEMQNCYNGWSDTYDKAQIIGVVEELVPIEVSEEDELKFYYVDSIDDYWIGQRLDNFYYAKWNSKLGFVWSASRYLPWGEHIVAPDTLWKEHTYPSEPREIPFTEWIVGFMKKHSVIPKPKEVIYGNEHNCIMTLFGECSYSETGCGDCAVVEKVREALSAEVSEDCISKHDLWRIVEDNAYWVTYNETSKEKGMTLTGINQALNECPPVVPQQKEGEWIADDDGDKKCSNCGEYAPLSFDDYYMRGGKIRQEEDLLLCPYCGAKMRGNNVETD